MLALRSLGRLRSPGQGRRGRSRRVVERASFVSRARNILRFRAFASFSSSSLFFVPLYASLVPRERVSRSFSHKFTHSASSPCRRAHLSPASFGVSFASLSLFCRRVDSLNFVIHLPFRRRCRIFTVLSILLLTCLSLSLSCPRGSP